MEILPAEGEHRLELQLGLQARCGNAVRNRQRYQVAETIRKQAGLALAKRRAVTGELYHVKPDMVGKSRRRGKLETWSAAQPGRAALDHGARQHRDRASPAMLASVRPAMAEPDLAGRHLDGLVPHDGNRLSAELQVERVMI